MKKLSLILFCTLFFAVGFTTAQSYDIVIKGGHIIDPKNNVDEVMDIAVKDGKIAAISKNINTSNAVQVVSAQGLYVTPGLIDIHAHVFWGTNPNRQWSDGILAIQPDGFTFRSGVTTIVDAGSAGWRNFQTFKKRTIDIAKTRVLAFLNIMGDGMARGYEQNDDDMDPHAAAFMARQYSDYIVGFKLAHYDGHSWKPTDNAIEAGRLAGNIPIMVDFGFASPALSLKELFLDHFRPGDIYTHCFSEMGTFRESIYDTVGKRLWPYVWEARKKGIIFDVGYGGSSFVFSQALPASKEGFYPNSISTDLHVGSMNGPMKDMLTTMSRFLAMGMNLHDVIQASTWNPAKEIQRYELGHLSVGAGADIAILNLERGKYGFFDYKGGRLQGSQKLFCEMTIRDGKVVYDLNGIADPVVLSYPIYGKPRVDNFNPWYKKIPSTNNLNVTASNSINQEEFFRQYKKNPKYWDEAFEFFNNRDLVNLKPGTYVIDSGNVIATVVEGPTKNIQDIMWEAHKDFNDLQYVITGKASMGVAPVTDNAATVTIPYTHSSDIMHFTNDNGQYYDADPGVFFIFSPQEMHRPAIRVPESNKIKRIVIKVRVP